MNKFYLIALVILNVFSHSAALALTIGVTAGPHAAILEEVKKEFEKSGEKLKIVEFNDFILPNAALDQGDLDLNCFQHQPFLDDQVKSRGLKIVSIAKTIVLPMGIYSSRHRSIQSIPEGAKISIPNDATNGGRALLLLKKAGLIKLANDDNPSILNISHNPKKIKIIEIEAPQLPRTLKDVDLSIINTDWVLLSGLDPSQALLTESKNSPYANLIAVKRGNEGRPEIKSLVSIYQSKKIKDFIVKRFKGAILPAW